MDLEDEGWVNIPYEGFLDHDDGKKISSRKHVSSPKYVFKINYFNPPQNPHKFVDSPSKEVIPLKIQLDDDNHPTGGNGSISDNNQEQVKELTKLPIMIRDDHTKLTKIDQDLVFDQVFFKKENEFVEMKMGFSRSNSQETVLPRIETDTFQYEDKKDDGTLDGSSKVMLNEREKVKKEEEVITWGESNEGMNIWKWGLNGIGAFCSFGMAAATIFIIIFVNGQSHKQHNRIQIYSDDKRIKEVVVNANEAMSAVRGVALTKAHITYGGYYEGL